MADTSARMLRLLNLLQTHRFWPGIEIADRLGISERTLRRDVDRLRSLGYPVQSTRGATGGYQLSPGAAMPPLLLDDEEAVAIAVGLRTAAGGTVAGIEESSVRALAKVVQVMPPRLRRRVDALRSHTVPAVMTDGPTVDADTLTAIAHACRDTERLRFGYAATDAAVTARFVEPLRLVSLGRRWYLVAWDLDRHDWRTFRVDRIGDPVPSGGSFRPREIPGGDAAAFVRDRVRVGPTRQRVEIVVRAPLAEVTPVVSYWGKATAVDSTSSRAVLHVDDVHMLVYILSVLDADVTVAAPPSFRAHLDTLGARLSGDGGAASG